MLKCIKKTGINKIIDPNIELYQYSRLNIISFFVLLIIHYVIIMLMTPKVLLCDFFLTTFTFNHYKPRLYQIKPQPIGRDVKNICGPID